MKMNRREAVDLLVAFATAGCEGSVGLREETGVCCGV